MTIKGKAYIAGIYEHPTRHAPDKSTAQLHAEVAKGALEDAGLPTPHLNFVVRSPAGDRIDAMIDLAYPGAMVAVEYLGDHHRTDDETYQADIYRRERLMAAGWNVVFVTAADLRGPIPRAVISVRRALAISSSHNP